MNTPYSLNQSSYAQFILSFQAWVQSYDPVRQLSPNDLYYLMTWADNGVDARALTDHFDRFLSQHPNYMKDGFRLSSLRFEAEKFIVQRRQAMPVRETLKVYDPFEGLLKKIETLGQTQTNAHIRESLRIMWRNIRTLHGQALEAFDSWRTSAATFYQLKAAAISANLTECENLFTRCLEMLTPDERATFDQLSPEDSIHLLSLGPEASTAYRKMRRHQKIADYFHLSELWHYFD